MLISILTTEQIIPIIIGAVAGAIATFINWIIPTEAFKPRIKIKSYNQPQETITFTNLDGSKKEELFLKRNIHIVNDSLLFAAYNVSCFVELLDADMNIVYRETKELPVVKSNIREDKAIVLPFRKLSAAKLVETQAIKIKLNLVYENRYGTKKTSGTWWVKKYNVHDKTFVPIKE